MTFSDRSTVLFYTSSSTRVNAVVQARGGSGAMPGSPSNRTHPERTPRRGLKSDVARPATPTLLIRRIGEVLFIFPVPNDHLTAQEERFYAPRAGLGVVVEGNTPARSIATHQPGYWSPCRWESRHQEG